jgi:hypothetical protein
MDTSQSGCGFVYVATGAKYAREAAESAASLRRYHPEARVCLITDSNPEGEPFWNDLVVLEQAAFNFRDKIEMRRAPYERCIYLDTDTTVWGDLSELFTVLTRYDVCGVQYAEGQDYVMPDGIPHAFPEMNGGMIGFTKSDATGEFFRLWEKFYEEFRALNRDGHYHYSNMGDQKSLRAALWHSGVRHFSVGGEFNFIPFKSDFAALPVAVLHTRARRGQEELIARLNKKLGRRAYFPALDTVVMNKMQGSELRRLCFVSAKLYFVELLKALFPSSVRRFFGSRLAGARWLHGNRFGSAEQRESHFEKWKKPADYGGSTKS